MHKGTESQSNCNLQDPEMYGQKRVQKISDALHLMSGVSEASSSFLLVNTPIMIMTLVHRMHSDKGC